MAEPTPTFSVGELTDLIGEQLRAAFPAEVWVRGEIQDLTRAPSGHVYFTIADDGGDGDDGGRGAQLSVMLRARDKDRVNRLLMKAGGRVRMTDGTDVRIRGRLDFYAPRGQLQLRMVSIDPAFTLGQLAAARAALVEQLRAEGLLDRNGAIPMPALPLRVAVVTSVGSAAEADVLAELDRSGFRFDVHVAGVRVQGGEAPGSIAGAIRWCAPRGFDVILLARGGGSATDLAAFDDELVARAIADGPAPVLTGIGHEVDRTVADEVAHTPAKTPTAAAQHLVELVTLARDRAEAAFGGVVTGAARALRRESERLDRLAVRTSTAAAAATRGEHARVDHLAARLRQAPRGRLDRHAGELDRSARRLRTATRRALDDATRTIDVLAARVSAVDPERALARGWSITRDEHGVVVRSAAEVAPGTTIHTTLADGAVESTVTSSHPDGDGDEDSGR